MVIAYDRPVKNLIAGLNATGHVTHSTHRKTHVTLHHNGGILSHEGVLSVWQTRPASAHFDVDAAGAVAQYVEANEYAWACGSTEGNNASISIEMCNSSGSPNWGVSETTWRSAARLAGWLFARVIGARPTSSTLVRHKYWSSTACAGPHIDSVYGQMLAIAQQTYDQLTGAASGGGSNTEEDDDMRVITGEWAPGTDAQHLVTFPTQKGDAYFGLATGWSDAEVGVIYFIASGKRYLADVGAFTLRADDRKWFKLPVGCDQVSIQYTAAHPVAYSVELS